MNTIYYLKRVDVRTKRSMALAREKGSGSWLTALPIKSLGYTLNKRELMPLDNNLMRNGNIAENARLDVSGIGVWGPFERTFLDIRVMHPNAPSYVIKSIDQVYIVLEKRKEKSI